MRKILFLLSILLLSACGTAVILPTLDAAALAPGVRATVHSADGLVEAYENEQIWAVQFHPEKDLQAGDTRWLRLFGAFVQRCAK